MVLDPFFGTGTTGVVAQRNGRDWLGIELSPEYAELAWRRLDQDAPPAIPNAA
jgi:DNA modification methylase